MITTNYHDHLDYSIQELVEFRRATYKHLIRLPRLPENIPKKDRSFIEAKMVRLRAALVMFDQRIAEETLDLSKRNAHMKHLKKTGQLSVYRDWKRQGIS
jgi:hypothetical protein